jgi:hypothetical protein
LPGIPARKEDIMERTYQGAVALVGHAAGPLASHLGAFVSSLIDQQYSASVIYIKARHALAFDRWLAKRGLVLADLSEVSIERYQHRNTGMGADTNVSAVRPGAASATTSHNYYSSCAITVSALQPVSGPQRLMF